MLFFSPPDAFEILCVISCLPCSVGDEIEGSGSVGNVSFPNQEQRMDADPNQQLYLSEPVL